MTSTRYVRRLDWREGRIDLNHGAGGRASADLIAQLFVAAFDNPALSAGDDAAAVPSLAPTERLVITTDAHVVTPLFFPGGDIGTLAVHGTVNDLAMMGARPLCLTAAFTLEEGLPLATLRRIVASMAGAAAAVGVPIVAGDTKVVERGKADAVFITTTGVGAVPSGCRISAGGAKVGDAILLSGAPGLHGAAILGARESLGVEAAVRSDCAPLHELVASLCEALPPGSVHALRDPTRGGVATALNELAERSRVGMLIDEARLPTHPRVEALCELLGLDPLHLACEGRMLAIVEAREREPALAVLRRHPLAREAACIGTVINDDQHFVQMATRLGGRRLVDWLSGEPLPRIC